MFSKIKAFWGLMQAGKRVSDPALWKARQITATAVTAVLWALVHTAEALGMAIPLDSETADGLAVGIISVVNFVLTLATTNKIGIDGVRQDPPASA
jgi:hypothetical protein